MCKATLPSRHISRQRPYLYQAKAAVQNKADSKYKHCEWPAAALTAGPGEALVAWLNVPAAMEMLGGREGRDAQQEQCVCFSEAFGSSGCKTER